MVLASVELSTHSPRASSLCELPLNSPRLRHRSNFKVGGDVVDRCYITAVARSIALLAAAGTILSFQAAHAEIRKLTILHSNDLHARLLPDDRKQGGFAYLATLVKQQKQQHCGDNGKECLYLNAGDLVQGTPVSTIYNGNHEFDYGWQQIPTFLKEANYPVVSANVVRAASPEQRITKHPYLIRKVNGMRVAIIGAAMANLVSGFLTDDRAGPWTAQPVAATAARYAAELRKPRPDGKREADVVLVLGHILQKEGSEILQTVPDIGAVIEGHDHRGRKDMEVVTQPSGKHVAVGCAGYGVELCKLELSIEMPAGKIVDAKWERIPVDAAKIQPDPHMAKLVDKWEKRVAKLMDVKIATANRDFDQAALVPMIEQAFREELQVDFAATNRGGVRDRLPKGDVLVRHIWNIAPFDNQMMIARGVKGSQLTSFVRDSEKLDPQKVYTIATSDFIVNNAGTRKTFGLEGIRFEPTEHMMRDVFLRWVKRQGVLQ
jgi:5'-nucleotidase / UDP-sugar diphosphatase